ncbi:MAG: hypothetical protein WA738_09780 [Candidatus Angelobacter sp.]
MYSYVDNNPINGIDPDGHSPQMSPVADSIPGNMMVGQGYGANLTSTSEGTTTDFSNLPNEEEQQQAHNQGQNFNRVAQSRAEELEGQKVTVVRASSVDGFASALKNQVITGSAKLPLTFRAGGVP